jgi:hypothetical protein
MAPASIRKARHTVGRRAVASAVHLQGADEGFLRDVHLAEGAHLLLAGLLLFQQLFFRVASPP